MTPLTQKIAGLLQPLERFYQKAGQQAPKLQEIPGAQMPEPYRSLLVHERDMTPTLETFFETQIAIQPLSVHLDEKTLTRQVVLEAGPEKKPVEFGAIHIHLDHFPETARAEILQCRTPMGTILRTHAIGHYSRPSGYFRITSDPVTTAAFDLKTPQTLYGRHNVIRDSSHRLLAEVVEILPPIAELKQS